MPKILGLRRKTLKAWALVTMSLPVMLSFQNCTGGAAGAGAVPYNRADLEIHDPVIDLIMAPNVCLSDNSIDGLINPNCSSIPSRAALQIAEQENQIVLDSVPSTDSNSVAQQEPTGPALETVTPITLPQSAAELIPQTAAPPEVFVELPPTISPPATPVVEPVTLSSQAPPQQESVQQEQVASSEAVPTPQGPSPEAVPSEPLPPDAVIVIPSETKNAQSVMEAPAPEIVAQAPAPPVQSTQALESVPSETPTVPEQQTTNAPPAPPVVEAPKVVEAIPVPEQAPAPVVIQAPPPVVALAPPAPAPEATETPKLEELTVQKAVEAGLAEAPPEPKKRVCDPFAAPPGKPEARKINLGVIGELLYVDKKVSVGNFAQLEKNAKKADANIYLNQLFVPTVAFSRGFINENNEPLKSPSGQVLFEYFGLKFKGQLQIARPEDAGIYQIALLSDDGANLRIQDPSTGKMKGLIANDGNHPTRMACSAQTIVLDVGSKIPFELDYYQGPRFHVAMALVWRKVQPGMNMAEPLCGKSGNGTFWDSTKFPSVATGWKDLQSRGWRPVQSEELAMPERKVNPCNDQDDEKN